MEVFWWKSPAIVRTSECSFPHFIRLALSCPISFRRKIFSLYFSITTAACPSGHATTSVHFRTFKNRCQLSVSSQNSSTGSQLGCSSAVFIQAVPVPDQNIFLLRLKWGTVRYDRMPYNPIFSNISFALVDLCNFCLLGGFWPFGSKFGGYPNY